MSKLVMQGEQTGHIDTARSTGVYASDNQSSAAKVQARSSSSTLRKVPEILAAFWLIKILTTAMGEATSDYLVRAFNPVIAVALGGVALVVALALQFSVKKYVPWVYWLSVSMVAVFGTMAADALHIGLGIPYIYSAAFFAVSLGLIFAIWYAVEKTLSIHSVTTPRRELFYWATVMATFALGTATGDMTATTLHLGYLASGVLFLIVILVPAIGYWRFGLNSILAFWFAYIITRPLGASFADWIGVSPARGGLGFGAGLVSVVLTVIIIVCVAWVTIDRSGSSPKQ